MLPPGFSRLTNFPNPLNPSTVINYALPNATNVKLEVYDALGREVKTLVDERQTAGNHEVTFNAGSLPSGGYIFGWRRDEAVPNIRVLWNLPILCIP